MVAPLGAGQLDVGGGAISAGLYNAVSRGIDVRVVADLGSDPPGYGFQKLIVRSALVKSGRFRSGADLKGMTIAITAPGISTSSMLNELLKKNHLRFSDVTLVYMSNPDIVAAMRNGSVDASLMPEPGATIAAQSGVAEKILGDDTYYANQQIAVLLFGSNLLKAHRDLGVKFMRSYLKAVRFYNDTLKDGRLGGPHAAEILKIFSEETKLSDPSILAGLTPNGVNPNGQLDLSSMRKDFQFFSRSGLIAANVKPEDAIDLSFLTDALKQLGPYR
jgi:NitT/TauT family transport system substrate-binding protein